MWRLLLLRDLPHIRPAEARVPGSSDEDDLLESSGHRRTDSRLSCQLILTEAPGELIVRIAPED